MSETQVEAPFSVSAETTVTVTVSRALSEQEAADLYAALGAVVAPQEGS